MGMIRVLVVDDSLFMRKVISDLLSSDPQISVVGTARNGIDALDSIPKLKPDVITLDIEMPQMDGLTALREIMNTNPTPVIMLSALTQEGAEQTFEALDNGAVDYLPKPSGTISLNMKSVRHILLNKVKTAANAHLNPFLNSPSRPKIRRMVAQTLSNTDKVISIGASTGGPRALSEVLSQLPKSIPPIMIVQHMPEFFTKPFAERLDKLCTFNVKEASEMDRMEEGQALLAPGDFHMMVTKNERIHLHKGPAIFFLRPTVDELMVSAAKVFGKRNLGVILTGMGSDGAKGMRAIKDSGGETIAQNEATCVVFGMPKVAIEQGSVDVVLPLNKIPHEMIRRCKA